MVSCLEDLEEDIENLRPKRKIPQKKETPKRKRPAKRIRLNPYIDDEAIEAETESEGETAESKF